jgi:hypothetical protein
MTKSKGKQRAESDARTFIDSQIKQLLRPLEVPDAGLDGIPEQIAVDALRRLNADREKALKPKLHASVVEQAVVQLEILEAEQAAEKERAAREGVWTTTDPR